MDLTCCGLLLLCAILLILTLYRYKFKTPTRVIVYCAFYILYIPVNFEPTRSHDVMQYLWGMNMCAHVKTSRDDRVCVYVHFLAYLMDSLPNPL